MTPSSWVIVNEPSTFAPSSKWSNRDMDPGAPPASPTKTFPPTPPGRGGSDRHSYSSGGLPDMDQVLMVHILVCDVPPTEKTRRFLNFFGLVILGLPTRTTAVHTTWLVQCSQSVSRGSNHSPRSSSVICSSRGLLL